MTEMDIDFNEPPFDIESGRYNWDVFHASPHARAKEKMLRHALKMASLATGVGAAGLLYKAKRAYQRFMGAHNLNPMPNIVSPSGKRKRKRRGKNLRGEYPKEPRGAPYPIEPPSMPETSSASTQTCAPPPAPLQAKKTYITMIGDMGLAQKNGLGYLKGPRGWKFNPRDYRFCRSLFSPITFKIGDVMTQEAVGTSPSPWISDKGFDPRVVNVGRNRMWHTGATTGGTDLRRPNTGSRSTVRIEGTSNTYCDLCLPILPYADFGRLEVEGTDVTNHPFTFENLFNKVSNSGTTTGEMLWSLTEWGGGAYFFEDTTKYSSDLAAQGDHSLHTLQYNAFIQLETEFRIFNNSAKAMNYEIYMCYPKEAHDYSPLFCYDTAYRDSLETKPNHDANLYLGTAGDLNFCMHKSIGYTPTSLKSFNDAFRTVRKNYTVAGGHCLILKHRIPLSLVQNDIVQKLRGSHAFANIPGLTSWMWIRAYGNLGYDSDTNTGGYGPGIINIQQFQKIKVLKHLPRINKRVDTIRYPNYAITPDEVLAQENNT